MQLVSQSFGTYIVMAQQKRREVKMSFEPVVFNCKKSITGKFDTKYCSIICKQINCNNTFILVELLNESFPCEWCDGEIGVGNKCFLCPKHGEYPLCFGCISVKDALGGGAELTINMERAKQAITDIDDMTNCLNNLNEKKMSKNLNENSNQFKEKITISLLSDDDNE